MKKRKRNTAVTHNASNRQPRESGVLLIPDGTYNDALAHFHNDQSPSEELPIGNKLALHSCCSALFWTSNDKMRPVK